MSLAGLLTKRKVDAKLDDIFKSSAAVARPSTSVARPSITDVGNKKRKREKDVEREDQEENYDANKVGVKARSGSLAKQVKLPSATEESAVISTGPLVDDEEDEPPSTESEGDDELPVHESLNSSRKKKAAASKKVKYVPDGETRELRDSRTIFIGNLPVEIVKSKPLTKQLKRHILSHIPSAAIESIRFRSVAFNNPTTPLQDDADAKGKLSTKQQRQQSRAAEWRDQTKGHNDGGDNGYDKEEAENKKGEKSYMTPAEKRRLAAIKGEVHSHAAATTNAYVVFAHPAPQISEANVPRKLVMDPYDAAREVTLKCDGTLFAEHTIRVDLVAKGKDIASLPLMDPKLSVFVGNLDFATTDDDLRSFFEALLTNELGKPAAALKGEKSTKSDGREDAKEAHVPRWVSRVRVVRDRDTQLGKGIAYVQFSDRDCIDEILALGAEKLKFAKRSLRIQRCKTSAAVAAKAKTKTSQMNSQSPSNSTSASRPHSRNMAAIAPPTVPKGDPSLGERLAGLPKDKRKEAKASDSTRVARRLAKKKARAALTAAGVKEKRGGKVRERERRGKKELVNPGRKEGKKRVRSDRLVEKRNTKK